MTSTNLASLALEMSTGTADLNALAGPASAGISGRLRRLISQTLTGSPPTSDVDDDEPAATPSALSYGVASRIGSSHRRNDDSALAVTSVAVGDAGVEPAGIFVVADGMSQYGRGADASRAVIVAFRELAASLAGGVSSIEPGGDELDVLEQHLARSAVAAHERLAGTFGAGSFRAGSTLAAAVVVGADAIVAHLGDSRVYLLRAELFQRLTDDHSPVFQALLRGDLTPEAAADHPSRSAIAQYVANDRPRPPEMQRLRLAPGDRLLLCSDGIWSALDDEVLAAMLANNEPSEAAQVIVAEAVAAGSTDDATAIVIRAEQAPWESREP